MEEHKVAKNFSTIKKALVNSTPEFIKKENNVNFETTPYKSTQQDKECADFAYFLNKQSPLIDMIIPTPKQNLKIKQINTPDIYIKEANLYCHIVSLSQQKEPNITINEDEEFGVARKIDFDKITKFQELINDKIQSDLPIDQTQNGLISEDYQNEQDSSVNLRDEPKSVCNCKNSQCLKLYCDCFKRGLTCSSECRCHGCKNNETNIEELNISRQNILEKDSKAFDSKFVSKQYLVQHTKGCTCKKSKCQQKYCECYTNGVGCTDICQCENCHNHESNYLQSSKKTVKKLKEHEYAY